MTKKFLHILSVTLAMLLVLTACGAPAATGSPTASGTASDGGAAPKDKDGLKVVFLTSSSLGDDPLVDVIWDAVQNAGKDFSGISEVKCVELNNDTSVFASSVMDLCETGEWDVIVTGFWQMVEPVTLAVEEYPDQKFLIFDSELDYSSGKYNNCVSVEGLQNEGSFLAGALAALLTTSGIDGTNPEKVVGFIGASPGTTIDDFLLGYIDGVNYVDSGISVVYSYSGSFNDTAASKEHALAQYSQGADVCYAVMGAAGLGVADAALEKNRYMMGVDTDLALEVKDNNLATAQRIVTSCCKNFSKILYDQLGKIADNTIAWGTHTRYGVAQEGMFLVDNEFYQAIVPEDVKKRYEEIKAELVAGKIKVSTTIGASQDAIDAVLAKAAAY